MKYYYHPVSPNCRKTTAILDYLDYDNAERIVVDLPKGAQLRPEFLAINPNGRVPALEDGDLKLWESNAIAIYLADKAGTELWREDLRLDILRWMFWEQGHLMYATGIPFFQRIIKPMLGEESDEQRIEEALRNFVRLMKVLDDHLTGRDYLVGDFLTVADFAVASNLSFTEPCGLPMDDYRNVNRWLAGLDEIPAWNSSAPPPFPAAGASGAERT
jgi:glutathione S-transferase